jgi:hypothetical protein
MTQRQPATEGARRMLDQMMAQPGQGQHRKCGDDEVRDPRQRHARLLVEPQHQDMEQIDTITQVSQKERQLPAGSIAAGKQSQCPKQHQTIANSA